MLLWTRLPQLRKLALHLEAAMPALDRHQFIKTREEEVKVKRQEDTPHQGMLVRFQHIQELLLLMLLVIIFDLTCYRCMLAMTGTESTIEPVPGMAEARIGKVTHGATHQAGVAEAITQVRRRPHGRLGVNNSLTGRVTGTLQSLLRDGIFLSHRRRCCNNKLRIQRLVS